MTTHITISSVQMFSERLIHIRHCSVNRRANPSKTEFQCLKIQWEETFKEIILIQTVRVITEGCTGVWKERRTVNQPGGQGGQGKLLELPEQTHSKKRKSQAKKGPKDIPGRGSSIRNDVDA